MAEVKVVILLCVIFSSLQFSESTRRQYFKSNIRRNTFHPDERNNCICFQRSEKLTLVPNLLNSRNHGYERLVVYFYKDRVTQQIQMYTPSADKQYIIPDLPFEVGDSFLTITHTDTVHNAVNMSPHKIVQNTTQDLHAHDTDIDHFDEPVTASIGDEPVTAAPIGMNTGKIETRPLHDLLPHIVNSPDQNVDINNVIQSVDGHYQEVVNKVPGQLAPGNIGDSFDSVNVDMETDNVNPWQTKDVDGNHEYNWQEFNNVYNRYNGTSIFDQYLSLHEDGYLTFDKWFQQQLERFHSMHGQGSFGTIDVETLRILIQQTLQKNNIFISIDGILTDSQGTIIDVSNLKLRPVFIGNTLEYENFLKASGSKFSLPTNMPYLEALVVSLKHPPKMLGIIPMGKTFIPQIGGTVSNMHMKKGGPPQQVASITKSHCVNGNCKTEVVSNNLPYGRSSGRRIIPGFLNTEPVIKPAYSPIQQRRGSWRRNPKSKRAKHRLNENELEPIVIDLKDLERGKETRRFPDMPFGSLIKQAFKVLLDSSSRRGNNEPGKSGRQDGDDSSYEEDKPDFRIIGGSPATGSGTPVSSRGRSGIID